MLSGFGTKISSVYADVPAPNCISVLLSDLTLLVNLFATFLNLNKYGTVYLWAEFRHQ